MVHWRDANEFRDLLTIELSEFRKLSHKGADSVRPNALHGIQDFDLACICLVRLNRCFDLSLYRFQLFFQASNHSLDRFADIAIDRLLDAVLLLIHEIQKLPPPLNQSAKFDFVIVEQPAALVARLRQIAR